MIHFAHIGLPKSASTWLQTSLFARHPELQVVTKTGAFTPRPYDLLWEFRTQAPHQFVASDWKSRFSTAFASRLDASKTRGISDEELANGGIMHTDETMLTRIREVFGEIKIILVVRHPIQFLRSAYGEYISKGGTQTVDEFYNPERAARLARRIDFPGLVEDARRLFSREQVQVLPFEMIKHQGEQAFVDRICSFLGVAPIDVRAITSGAQRNRGLTAGSLPFFRVANAIDRTVSSKVFKDSPRLRMRYALDSFLKRVPLDKNSPSLEAPSVELVGRLPEVSRILRTERFALWSDEMAAYNYDLGDYDFGRS